MKLKPGSIIRVFGDVFFKGLDAGDYRVAATWRYGRSDVYAFTKRRGRKRVCNHLASSIDYCIQPNNTDLNRIEIVSV